IGVSPRNGTYTATVTDASGDATTCSVFVTVNPFPTCSIVPVSRAICAGSTATFTASSPSPGAGFSWEGPGGFTAIGASITVGIPGTYTAAVSDANLCVSYCSAELTVNDIPTCSISPASATICSGQTATFTAGSPSPGATFTWTGPSGFTASGP